MHTINGFGPQFFFAKRVTCIQRSSVSREVVQDVCRLMGVDHGGQGGHKYLPEF